MRTSFAMLSCFAVMTAVSAASAQARDDAAQQEVRRYWQQQLLAPPTGSTPAAESPVAMPESQRQQVLREVQSWGWLARTAATDNHDRRKTTWWNINYLQTAPSLRLGTLHTDPGSWPFLAEGGWQMTNYSELPAWMVDAVEKEVRNLSLAAPAVKPTLPPRKAGWDEGGNAFAWAGPAVKDGTATYRTKDGNTTVRIAMPSELPAEIYRMAAQQGYPLQLRLQRGGFPVYPHTPLIVEGRTDMPVWLVSAERFIPARFTAFSAGGAPCDGSQWMEFSYKGAESLPVWAVLGFTDATLANGITARRVPSAEKLGYQEAQRSEVEVRWPNERLSALRIVARRFEWTMRQHEIQPDGNYKETGRQVVGSAWGTQVLTKLPEEMKKHYSGPEWQLSSAGTPACSPP